MPCHASLNVLLDIEHNNKKKHYLCSFLAVQGKSQLKPVVFEDLTFKDNVDKQSLLMCQHVTSSVDSVTALIVPEQSFAQFDRGTYFLV